MNEKGNFLPESVLPDLSAKACTTPRPACSTVTTTCSKPICVTHKAKGIHCPLKRGGNTCAAASGAWKFREKLGKGKPPPINDLITLNLDIRQFAQDAIANCRSPELLAAFFDAFAA